LTVNSKARDEDDARPAVAFERFRAHRNERQILSGGEGRGMSRLHAFFLLAAMLVAPLTAQAQAAPAPLTPAEHAAYVRAASVLHRLYPTPAAAIKAGWFRYNNEDDSGAISYMNPKYFETPDVAHPQQLWYDVHGRLLGGDFSQLVALHPKGPTLFGFSPARFGQVPLHIHYGVRHGDGTIEYGLYVPAPDLTAAGFDPLHPTKAELVKLGKVKRAADVVFVFANLNNWDATMWLIPNPAGQFEDKNPNVTPSANQGKVPSERKT
jgi:hypothetical protein